MLREVIGSIKAIQLKREEGSEFRRQQAESGRIMESSGVTGWMNGKKEKLQGMDKKVEIIGIDDGLILRFGETRTSYSFPNGKDKGAKGVRARVINETIEVSFTNGQWTTLEDSHTRNSKILEGRSPENMTATEKLEKAFDLARLVQADLV